LAVFYFIQVFFVAEIIVEINFIFHPQKYEGRTGNTYSQPENVQKGKTFVLPKISERCF
jgi:hypothetical protein